jgi:hypothetical protein
MQFSSPPIEKDTPAIQLLYKGEAFERTQLAGTPVLLFGAAAMLTGDDLVTYWDLPGELTGVSREAKADRGKASRSFSSDGERDVRLHLLARKYGRASFSPEDEARLEILNERLRGVMQRVREEDVAALESAAQQLEDSRALRKHIEEKFEL